MRGSRINLNGEPRGIFMEGTVLGTPLPGTIMTLVPNVAPIGGRFQWQVAQMGGDGDPRLQAVLTEDLDQGQLYSTAYVNGARCFLYVPLLGEEMNVLAAGEAGTGSANAHFIGDRMIVQHNTGLVIVTSTSSQVAPWLCMEHLDIAADVAGLLWCMRAG